MRVAMGAVPRRADPFPIDRRARLKLNVGLVDASNHGSVRAPERVMGVLSRCSGGPNGEQLGNAGVGHRG